LASSQLEYLGPLVDTSPPTWSGPVLFATIAGGGVFLGSERQVEVVNSALFGAVLLTFVGLVGLGAPQINGALLARSDVAAVVPAVPIMVLSLVFHNVVPTICYQLGCDLGKIRTAILAGSAIPTAMFILWNLVILGSVPPEAAAAVSTSAVFDPLEGLRATGDAFGGTVRAFSLFAILTSFIGFCVGLVDYFADALAQTLGISTSLASAPDPTPELRPALGAVASATDDPGTVDKEASAEAPADLGGNRYTLTQRAVLFGVTLLPPLAIAEYDPTLFFAALDNAGTFGILVLFGIIPAAMAWQQRYGGTDIYSGANDEKAYGAELAVAPVLPGGRLTLGAMAATAAVIVALETYERFASVA